MGFGNFGSSKVPKVPVNASIDLAKDPEAQQLTLKSAKDGKIDEARAKKLGKMGKNAAADPRVQAAAMDATKEEAKAAFPLGTPMDGPTDDASSGTKVSPAPAPSQLVHAH